MKIFKRYIERKRKLGILKRFYKFMDDVGFEYEKVEKLSKIQRYAILCFWYDAEMGSGGHSCYFNCCSDVPNEELEKALLEISSKQIANNFMDAVKNGKKDDYEKSDNRYYEFSPSLDEYLDEYIFVNKDEILK